MSPSRSNRPKLLIPYLLIGLGVLAFMAAVVPAKLYLGAWTGWIAAPLCLAAALWLGRKVIGDTHELPAGPKYVFRFLGSGMVVSLIGAFSFTVTEGVNPYNALNITAAIVYINGWLLIGLLALVRWALTRRAAIPSVARQIIDEALGLRIVNGFLILFLLIIPALVFFLSPDQPVRYRIQQFLEYGLGITEILLAGFVVLFGAWSLTGEFTGKQVQVSLVKPLGRGAFLAGKCLGLVILSGLMLGIAGLSIYLFAVFYLAEQPAMDQLDALLVEQEVLTAREARPPRPPESLFRRVEQRLEEMLTTDTGRSLMIERGGQEAVRNELMQRELTQWRSMGPYRRSQRWQQDYYFDNLERARARGGFLSLRYKIKIKGEWGVQTRLAMVVNDGQAIKQFDSPLDIVQRIPIDTKFIPDTGTLKVTLVNLNQDVSVFFPDKELELLYAVDRFGPNYLRGLAILWVKLSFLVVLVLSVSTYLGFAVASLASGLIWVIASYSPYLMEAAGKFKARPEDEETVRLLTTAVRWVATSVSWLLSRFADYEPIGKLSDGRYIGWDQLFGCVGWIGLGWSLPLALMAWVIFRRRELARVQV